MGKQGCTAGSCICHRMFTSTTGICAVLEHGTTGIYAVLEHRGEGGGGYNFEPLGNALDLGPAVGNALDLAQPEAFLPT